MEGVEARGLVIGELRFTEFGSVRKSASELSYARLAVVLERQPEERLVLKVKDQLGLSLGGVLKIIHLPAAEERERVVLIPFGEGERGVGLRVVAVILRVEILEKIDIADPVHIGRSVDVIGEEKSLLEGNPVAVCGARLCWLAGGFDGRHIFRFKNIVRDQISKISTTRAVFHIEIEADGGTEFRAFLEADGGIDSLGDWKRIREEQISPPAGIITGEELETRAIQIGIEEREPKDRCLPDIECRIRHHDTVAGIKTNRAGLHMIIRLGRIVRGQRAIADTKFLGRNGAKIKGAKVERILRAGKLERPHLFALEIKKGALARQDLVRRVNSNVANEQDIAGVGVVFRVVAEDAVFAVVDLDIVLGDRNAFVEPRAAIGCDFHRKIPETPELRTGCR